MFLEVAVRIGRSPRPRNLGGKIGRAAEAARSYRGVCALFDRTRFEDHGVSRGGCQSRRPLSEPSLSEHGFQLFACCPHRLPFMGRGALFTPNSYPLTVAAKRLSVRSWHGPTIGAAAAAVSGIGGSPDAEEGSQDPAAAAELIHS